MMANEVKNVKKPFDKKKWRNEKYSKKIKGKTRLTFEEIKNKVIHDYPLFQSINGKIKGKNTSNQNIFECFKKRVKSIIRIWHLLEKKIAKNLTLIGEILL